MPRSWVRSILLILCACSASPVWADLATIQVDVKTKVVVPDNPTINIAANDAVIVKIISDGKPLASSVEVGTYVAVQRVVKEGETSAAGKRMFVYTDSNQGVAGATPLLIFKRCDGAEKDYEVTLGKDTQVPHCPFASIDESGRTWTILIDQGIVLVRIVTFTRDKSGVEVTDEETAFAIQVVNRPYALDWSAGFAFLDLRDNQYRLDPIVGDADHVNLVSNGRGPVPYELAAFAHYRPFHRKSPNHRSWLWHALPTICSPFSMSFGLGTNVPVNALTAMAGVSYSLQTLPLGNSGYLTAGGAYGPRKSLTHDYRGLNTLPAGVGSETLLEQRQAFGWFLAFTFSFLGGEEQFKGVYSGKSPQK